MPRPYSQLVKLKTPENPEAHALAGRLGIYLRLYPSGDHQWYWRGNLGLNPIWVKIGPKLSSIWTLKALQDEAIRLRQLVDKKIDPNAPKPKPVDIIPTLDEAWEAFKAEYVIPLRSAAYLRGMETLWRLHIHPRFGSMPIDTVTTETALEVVRPLLQGKKLTTANRLRSQLSKLYNWSAGRWPKKVDAVNWTKAVSKAEVPVNERVLTKKELAALGKGFLKSQTKHRFAVLWLLLTGSRAGVLLVWNSSWVEGQFVIIPQGVEGVKKARAIVMPESAASIISKLAFPLTSSALRHAVDDIISHAGITTGRISPHTLRKTWSSLGADLGEPEPVIDALQNHKGSAIKQAYIRRSLEAMLPTAEKIATHLLDVMGIDPQQLKSGSIARVAKKVNITASTKPSPTLGSTKPEPSVGVKAARMFEKGTRATATKSRAVLFQRQKK
jgi:integrase